MYWKPEPHHYPPYLRTRVRRGQGVRCGQDYRPWLRVRDVPSDGTSSIVSGINIRRPFHLLSELEATYFFLAERKAITVDLMEQWPIFDIDRTLELSARFGVQHPRKRGFPEPFTIDFLISEDTGGGVKHRAASIKSADDARDPSMRRRLAVERAWCAERGIPWTLVDTSHFSKRLLSNLRFMRGWFRHGYKPDTRQADCFAAAFQSTYAPNVCLGELIQRAAKPLRLCDDTADDLFRYCAWTGRIAVSLHSELTLDRPLVRPDNERHG